MWVRYVGYVFVIIKSDVIENSYNLIKIVFDDIKSTMEKVSNNKSSLFDVLIIRTDTRKLETQVYEKPTHTDQILNYSSENPKTQKINYVQSLFKRVRTQCSTLSARKNEGKYLVTIHQKNGYPHKFTKKC